MSFTDWLDARDGATVARAWQSLDAKFVEVGRRGTSPPPAWWTITPHGAARVAAAFLGWPIEKLAWLAAEPAQLPPPIFDARRMVKRCFLEHGASYDQDCWEEWQIRELVDGARGVQHIDLGFWWDVGTHDAGPGGGAKVIRVFDRDAGRGASIQIASLNVWTIGDIDLAPLDLFAHGRNFKLAWKKCDLDAVRGFVAQIATELDAHFDVSSTWPPGVIADRVIDERERDYRARRRVHRFASAERAIQIDEPVDRGNPEYGWLFATVEGLPWGHDVRVRFSIADPVEGCVDLRLPLAQGDLLLARLASIPGIEVRP